MNLTKNFNYEAHASWRNDMRTLVWTRESGLTNGPLQQEFFENLPDNWDFWAVEHEGKHIGTAGLTDIDLLSETAEFSLLIDPAERGQGHGKQALDMLIKHARLRYKIRLLYGNTFAYPPTAKELLEGLDAPFIPMEEGLVNPAYNTFKSLGARMEGLLECRNFKFGHYVNVIPFRFDL